MYNQSLSMNLIVSIIGSPGQQPLGQVTVSTATGSGHRVMGRKSWPSSISVTIHLVLLPQLDKMQDCIQHTCIKDDT